MPFRREVDLILPARALVAEGPLWDPGDGTLLWVDIDRGEVHRLAPETGADSLAVACDRPVGAAVWRRSGGLALALPGGVALVAAGGDPAAADVVPVEADRPDQQLNDGACDRHGRFWVGTASVSRQPGTSALYRLDADHRVEQVLPGVTMSNGLGWSPDERSVLLRRQRRPAPRRLRPRSGQWPAAESPPAGVRPPRRSASRTASPWTRTAASGWRSGVPVRSIGTPRPGCWTASSTCRPATSPVAPSAARASPTCS